MDETTPSMSTLFQQLGLDDSDEAIASFIRANQLSNETVITKAPIWSDAQRQFLSEQLGADAAWAIVVDQLNEALHADAAKASSAA